MNFWLKDGSTFKAKYKFRPYFYVATKVSPLNSFCTPSNESFSSSKFYIFADCCAFVQQDIMEMDVDSYLRRRYESQIADIEVLEKEDLDLVSLLTSNLGFVCFMTAFIKVTC